MAENPRSPARLLAPLALVAFTVAFAFVVLASEPRREGSSANGRAEQESDLGPAEAETATEAETQTSRRDRESRLPEGCYVVRSGDTLGGIAERTGVQVDQLQELNPDVDPQQLVSGQRLNLREAGCD